MRVFSKDTSWNFQVVYFERTYVWQTGSTPPPFQAICKFSSEAVFNIEKTPGTPNCKWCGYFAIVFACVLQQNHCCGQHLFIVFKLDSFGNFSPNKHLNLLSLSTDCTFQQGLFFFSSSDINTDKNTDTNTDTF